MAGALEYELRALESAGIKFVRNEPRLSRRKVLHLALQFSRNGKRCPTCGPSSLRSIHIFARKYLRGQARSLVIKNPIEGNLCFVRPKQPKLES